MTNLFSPIRVNSKNVKNRILMPPLVCFNWSDENGYETVDRAIHYGLRAKSEVGFIVVEATAVLPEGRIVEKELGLWEDGQISQFEKIATACHKHDSVVIVQLVHAGMKAYPEKVKSSSAQEIKDKKCSEMTLEDIEEIKLAFVNAAKRAEAAGLDGIEIHGAHGYLLSQFTSSVTNKREDIYGGNIDNRIRLPLEIIEDIKKETSSDFLICYRFGVNDPTFEEDIYFAKILEQKGVALLNVSLGIGAEKISPPDEFPFSHITYMGSVIHKNVSIPVASVFGIRTPEQASYLIENNLTDFAAIGRGLLADPHWAKKALDGNSVNICLECPSGCLFRKDGRLCPQAKLV